MLTAAEEFYLAAIVICATFRDSDESLNLVRGKKTLFVWRSVSKKLIWKKGRVTGGGSCILLRRLVTNGLADLPSAGRRSDAVNSNVAPYHHRDKLQQRVCLWGKSNVNKMKQYWKLTEPFSICDDPDVGFHNESFFLSLLFAPSCAHLCGTKHKEH